MGHIQYQSNFITEELKQQKQGQISCMYNAIVSHKIPDLKICVVTPLELVSFPGDCRRRKPRLFAGNPCKFGNCW